MKETMGKRPEYQLDTNFRLFYGPDYSKILQPCGLIEDPSVCLGVIGNGILNPRALFLLPKDRQVIRVSTTGSDEIYEVSHPGKSAIINFENDCSKETVWRIVATQVDGQPDRRDHLHTTTVEQIVAVGWMAFWAPLQLERKILHARMVANRTYESGEDPTEQDVLALASVFKKVV